MKRFIKIIILLLLTLNLMGCEFISSLTTDDGLNAEELKTKLMITRNAIQRQNIIIKSTFDLGYLHGTTIQEGSGVVIDKDDDYYYILTNHHVADYTGEYGVRSSKTEMTNFYGDSLTPTRMVATTNYDLALFKVPASQFKTAVNPIDIESRLNDGLTLGEMVLAVGNPGNTTFNVTFGVYQQKRYLKDIDYPALQHSAIIFTGNSGGALTDVNGNLVGINTWGEEGNMNVGFAIGLDQIHDFLSLFEESTTT